MSLEHSAAPASWASQSMRAALPGLPQIRGGRLIMRLPEGGVLAFGDGAGPTAEIDIHDYGFARRVLFSGDIGFAESWIAGEWTSPDLVTLLALLADNTERIARSFNGSAIGWLFNRMSRLNRTNTRKGSKRNILAHYDLGNDFFATWLDPSMTYSSARFDAGAEDLESGQIAKYRAMARHAQLKPGDRVLEIGCGWGAFAELAAREFGAHVTALTISEAQFDFARKRIADAGLCERVEVRRQDYRDVEGSYDAVVSIEMLEAVGERYWQTYFEKIAAVLKPGGRAAVQSITMRDDLFDEYRRRSDFIQRHVFPGGMLPSLWRLKEEVAHAGLIWEEAEAFGRDYEATLNAWSRNFEANWRRSETLGFDQRFRRLWSFYLAYCIAGFRTRRIDVVQFSAMKFA